MNLDRLPVSVPAVGCDWRSLLASGPPNAVLHHEPTDLVDEVGLNEASCGFGLVAGLRVMEPAACHAHSRAQQADRIGGAVSGRDALARRLLDHLQPSKLCLADRAFVGFELWTAAGATGADLLWRLRVNQVLPCDEVLPDGSYLSRLYLSPKHRRQGEGGVTVRVIDYCLDGVPDAEPLYRLATTLLDLAAPREK